MHPCIHPLITILTGVIGGFVAKAPNALLTEQIGWRAVELCLFGLQVLALITLVMLWIIEYSCLHNNERANRRQHQLDSGVATTEDQKSLHRAIIAKRPSASAKRVVATACHKPRHVKVTTSSLHIITIMILNRLIILLIKIRYFCESKKPSYGGKQ